MKVKTLKQDITTKARRTGLSYEDLLYRSETKTVYKIEKSIITAIFRRSVSDGTLDLLFPDGDKVSIVAGSGKPHIIVRPPSLWVLAKIFINPELYALETYVRGQWSCVNTDLIDFISFIESQQGSLFNSWRRCLQKLPPLWFWIKQYLIPIRSTRRTHIHYDVKPEFYEKLLQPEMVYSCAFFDSQKDDLKQAQINKMKKVIQRAGIGKIDNPKILEIGCGWGITALYIAEQYPDAKIDAISIAAEQIRYAQNMITYRLPERAKQISFELCDYKDYRPGEANVYDHIVSIGVLEHVGKVKYTDYFNHVHRLLKPGSKAAIHCIVRNRPETASHWITNRWIDKNVFPGGYLPTISEVTAGIENSGLKLLKHHIHDGKNYYTTLEYWKKNLIEQYDDMLPMLTDKEADYKKVFRSWYAYLSGVQSLFLAPRGTGAICHFVVEKNN